MASITVTLTGTCAQTWGSGAHLKFSVTGEVAQVFEAELAEMTLPISKEDVLAFSRCLIRLAKVGRTNVQLRTLFQSGVTVTV